MNKNNPQETINELSVVIYNLAKMTGELENLNKNLSAANTESGQLTKALNTITLWGLIMSALIVTISLANFLLEIYKTFIL